MQGAPLPQLFLYQELRKIRFSTQSPRQENGLALLALNAAVEAARAGKYGKGFAAVAEEVGNLASRSAKAANEAADMIESSVKNIRDGSDIAGKSATSLEEIVAAVAKVTDLVGEIAAASTEQARGVSQVTVGLGQIDLVTYKNTAHAEESASAAEELSSQSSLLQKLMSTFIVSGNEQLLHPAQAPHRQKMLTMAELPVPPTPRRFEP
ncbi:methyl-accepting chemotaxis protein [Thermodesulfobacteriota bacterium]